MAPVSRIFGGGDNIARFELDLKRFAQTVEKDLKTVVKTCIFLLYRNIILNTPVDTGRAVGSWAVEKSAVGSFVLPELQGKQSASAAQAAALAKLQQFKVDDPYTLYWIFNNLPYIEVLEFGLYPGDGPKTEGGYSTQAPAGIVRVALAQTEARLLQELKRVLSK